MVVGIDKFREHFAGHEEQYVLIGGAACDLIFADAGLEFRATKDLDVVLCVEVVDVDFARAFLGFLEAGGYEARQQSEGHKEFYRFQNDIKKHRKDVFRLAQLLPADHQQPAQTHHMSYPIGTSISCSRPKRLRGIDIAIDVLPSPVIASRS